MNEEPKPDDPNGPAPAAPQPEAPLAPEELAELRRKAGEYDQLMDRLKRVTADYLNSQKRLERHAQERATYAIEAFARELLPVVDDIERAIKAVREHVGPSAEAEPAESVVSGLELVEKRLYAVLARHGIAPIETTVGAPFDSNGHEAIAVVQTDAMPPNCVVKELQRGFRLHGRMLRPARVAVSAPAADAEE